MVERSLVMCAGVESAFAALLIPALIKAHLASLTQDYMKLLMNYPELGEVENNQTEPVDAENDGGDENGDEEEEGECENDGKNAVKSGANRGVGENGNIDEEEEPDDENDEDDNGEDEEEEDVGEDNDEEDDDDEEALQPTKKGKK